jgi:hypothetical protein
LTLPSDEPSVQTLDKSVPRDMTRHSAEAADVCKTNLFRPDVPREVVEHRRVRSAAGHQIISAGGREVHYNAGGFERSPKCAK